MLKRTVPRIIQWCVCFALCFNLTGAFAQEADAAASSPGPRNVEAFKQTLDQLVPKLQDKYGVPGTAIGIVHEGRTAYLLYYGYADKKGKVALNENTLFQAGSISKSLTAWGILHLADQGHILLDDPAQKYLKTWKLPESRFKSNDVTIRRLLSHTAGLPPHKGYLGKEPGSALPSIKDSLQGIGTSDDSANVANPPGTEAIYSGAGYTILQLVAEEVTGMPFERYMEEEILEPLGMNASSFRQDMDGSNMAQAYGYFGQKLPNYQFAEQAAAGLRTNLKDLVTFTIASMDTEPNRSHANSVIPPERIAEMQRPVIGENGLGVFTRELSDHHTFVYHSGDNRGWHSLYGFVPETKDGLVILTNSENGIDLRQDVFNAWVKYETGKVPEGEQSLAQQRNMNSWISWGIGALLVIYVIYFMIGLTTGRRVFISKLPIRAYAILGVRTLILCYGGALLFHASYEESMLRLSSGAKYQVMLVMAWLLVLILTGIFPKKRGHAKRTNAGETAMNTPQ